MMGDKRKKEFVQEVKQQKASEIAEEELNQVTEGIIKPRKPALIRKKNESMEDYNSRNDEWMK